MPCTFASCEIDFGRREASIGRGVNDDINLARRRPGSRVGIQTQIARQISPAMGTRRSSGQA